MLLKAVAKRLRECARNVDTIARLGGDEFTIIQIDTQSPRDVEALAQRICKAMSAPFELDGQVVKVATSIGVVIGPKDGSNVELLMSRADLALYQAKETGRGSYHMFEEKLETNVLERRALGVDLNQALTDGSLELHYQPIITLENNQISGFEALLRWHHPEKGIIMPDKFISIAEETGQINKIGRWVLKNACAEAMLWPEHIKVAVNVSLVQFENGQIMLAVANALGSSHLPASRLELEITESVLLQDDEVTLSVLHKLRDLGVQIAMDDFGTGYSSLSYLQSFPFDKIKIDAAFIKNLSEKGDELGIVHAVVSLASKLGISTVAEGVETEIQLDVVRGEGCTEGQGYLFSRPMAADKIKAYIDHNSKNERHLKLVHNV